MQVFYKQYATKRTFSPAQCAISSFVVNIGKKKKSAFKDCPEEAIAWS